MKKTPESFVKSLTRVASNPNDIFKNFDISRKNSPFKLETKKNNINIILFFGIGILITLLVLIVFLIKKYYIDRKKKKDKDNE